MNKKLNLVMVAVSALILIGVNVGVWFASEKGLIVPVEDMLLWSAFVVLNVASILWGVSLLGLQPLVIAFSYVAGGALAYFGVRGMDDVSVAEIITAGATYGAFGALAIGNATQRVKLAFFNKGQVPFVFIIVGLLVVDAGLNSGVSSASGGVILTAVVLPFVVAGLLVGLTWSILNRFGIGRKPSDVLAGVSGADFVPGTLNVPVQEKSVKAQKSSPKKTPAPKKQKDIKPAKKKEPVAPVVKPVAEPVVVEKKEQEKPEVKKMDPVKPVSKPEAVKAAPVNEEAFFPLDIDEDDSKPTKTTKDDEEFILPSFDTSLYTSNTPQDLGSGAAVKKASPVSVDLDSVANLLDETEPVAGDEKIDAKDEKVDADGDWLGGHLDLLKKLK